MQWVISVSGLHLCGDTFHRVAEKGFEGACSCNSTNYNLIVVQD